MLPRVSSIFLKSVCEIILLEAVIWRSSIFPEKDLWWGSNTTPPTPCRDDALADFIASSTLGVTKFSVAVNTASSTLVSTVVITLSTSFRNLLTKFFSDVCISTCGSLTWVRSLVFFWEVTLSSNWAWALWMFSPIIQLALLSLKWLRSLLFCCFFFRVETMLNLTVELTNVVNKLLQKNRKQTFRERIIKSWFWVYWKQLITFVYFSRKNFFSSCQLPVVSSPLTLCSAPNQSTLFHDVKTVTTTATMAKNNIDVKFPRLHDVRL